MSDSVEDFTAMKGAAEHFTNSLRETFRKGSILGEKNQDIIVQGCKEAFELGFQMGLSWAAEKAKNAKT